VERVELVGTAADGEEALTLAARHDPDVVLMDLRMPRVDGVEAIRRLAERGERPRSIALTTYADDASVLGARVGELPTSGLRQRRGVARLTFPIGRLSVPPPGTSRAGGSSPPYPAAVDVRRRDRAAQSPNWFVARYQAWTSANAGFGVPS
jgi:CheY-like chemotaxis protein